MHNVYSKYISIKTYDYSLNKIKIAMDNVSWSVRSFTVYTTFCPFMKRRVT